MWVWIKSQWWSKEQELRDTKCVKPRWRTCWPHLQSWSTHRWGSLKLSSWWTHYRRGPPPAHRKANYCRFLNVNKLHFCNSLPTNSRESVSPGCRHMVWEGLLVCHRCSWLCTGTKSIHHKSSVVLAFSIQGGKKRSRWVNRDFKWWPTCRRTWHQPS